MPVQYCWRCDRRIDLHFHLEDWNDAADMCVRCCPLEEEPLTTAGDIQRETAARDDAASAQEAGWARYHALSPFEQQRLREQFEKAMAAASAAKPNNWLKQAGG